MTYEEQEEPTSDFDRRMNMTRDIRDLVAARLMPGGVIPENEDTIEIVMKLMNDMDKSEIQRRRIAVEDKSADTSRKVAEEALEMIRQLGNRNPFERAPDGSAIIPEAGEQDTDYDFTDGEKLQGMQTDTLPELEKRVGRED